MIYCKDKAPPLQKKKKKIKHNKVTSVLPMEKPRYKGSNKLQNMPKTTNK